MRHVPATWERVKGVEDAFLDAFALSLQAHGYALTNVESVAKKRGAEQIRLPVAFR